ncbi:MAG: glycine zipper 2TM domain-containing protein [Granulosicoccus sp.]
MKLKLSYHAYTRFLFPYLMVIACTAAQATDRFVPTERFTEYAKVVDVQPVYREVRLREPREECWTEQQRELIGYEQAYRHQPYQGQNHRERHTSNGVLAGSIIGGVIGNQLGRGHSSSSRTGATIAGALIGGTIANEATASSARHRAKRLPPQAQRHPVYETRPVEKCRRVVESRYEKRLRHYNVTYVYKGRTFTTQLPRDPGDRLELQVSVAPARR